jgi:class 3 adenylate cyclase
VRLKPHELVRGTSALRERGSVLDEIEEFLTGVRPASQQNRILATVLFTDIVGSTERAASLGDQEWLDLREAHDRLVRAPRPLPGKRDPDDR